MCIVFVSKGVMKDEEGTVTNAVDKVADIVMMRKIVTDDCKDTILLNIIS